MARKEKRLESILVEANSSVVILNGGTGNQLFQYCLARQIGMDLGITVYLDTTLLRIAHISSNQRPTIEKLSLPQTIFFCNVGKLKSHASKYFSEFSRQMSREYLAFIRSLPQTSPLKLQQQSNQIYDREIKPEKKSVYMGSFTSVQYWQENAGSILQEITESLAIYSSLQRNSREVEGLEIVIHARRGDFFSNPKTRKIHGVYGIEYYLKGLSMLDASNFKSLTILSDDFLFATHLQRAIVSSFPYFATKISAEKDPLMLLSLYSRSKAFIGSNSTFSWWLANLGNNKVRILPAKWFDKGNFELESSEYFPLKTQLLSAPFE